MKNLKILIRHSKVDDLIEIQELFVNTISIICKEDYSSEQIKIWASSIKNTQRWMDKLSSQYFLIAELENKIVGYASLENDNHLDFLYVHKDYQRQSIASKLYSEIEVEAIKRNAAQLHSDVSITAKPFFEKKDLLQKKNKLI